MAQTKAGNSVFDRLARSISREERESVLASIRQSLEQDLAPLVSEEIDTPPPLEEQIKSLGLWGKIKLFFLQIFTSETREAIITGWVLAGLRQQVQKIAGDALDARRGIFLGGFADSLEALQLTLHRATPYLDAAATRREELVFHLAADQFPVINGKLLKRTSEEYLSQQEEQNERTLKHDLTRYLEDRIADIPSKSSARIRRALSQADDLVRIGSFPFHSVLGSFSGSAETGDRQCPFDYITHSIERLASDVSSLSDPLEPLALENMVLLSCDQIALDTPEALQKELEAGLAILATVIRGLREFADHYPLVLLVRLIREDPWWNPPDAEYSGNDWLSIYRGKLEERIRRETLRVSLHRQVQDQVLLLEEVVDDRVTRIKGLPDGSDGLFLGHWHLALAGQTFASSLWRNTMSPLRQILNGADFYKSSNRAQFNDTFNEYEKIPDDLAGLEALVMPGGDWGQVLHSDEPLSRRREMADRVDREIEMIITSLQTTLEMMKNLLGGILYSRPGSSYDTIANYGQIGGRRNAELIDELKEIHSALQRLVGVIGEIGALEKRASENDMFLRPAL
ncbi:DUF5312 family protein [Alkalispirochaeta americana]|nr:DUF5312 family protein [Alkalispirochaeta americana]